MDEGLPMFKVTLLFIIITIGFYIDYCLRGINLCFGDFQNDEIYYMAATPLYGGHYLFFMILLFHRLYEIFSDTVYKLSKCSIYFFYFLVIFGLIDATFYLGFSIFDNNGIWGFIFYLIGTLAIILTYVWISCLYIIKLFKIIRDSQTNMDNIEFSKSKSSVISHRQRSASNVTSKNNARANKQILSSMTKYTLLTTISVLTNSIFWCVVFMPQNNYFKHMFIHLMFWQLSITVNIIGFTLGFYFSSSLYNKLCSKLDNICKLCFQSMVDFVIQKQININEKNIELHIKDHGESETPS